MKVLYSFDIVHECNVLDETLALINDTEIMVCVVSDGFDLDLCGADTNRRCSGNRCDCYEGCAVLLDSLIPIRHSCSLYLFRDQLNFLKLSLWSDVVVLWTPCKERWNVCVW